MTHNKYTYEEIVKYIESLNGICLSKEYINCMEKLEIQCNVCNNIWKSTLNNIKRNRWCPQCSKENKVVRNTKYTIEEIIEKANERNGKCLSTNYIPGTKLKFQCNECNFIWETDPKNIIQSNSWCPECAKKRMSNVNKNVKYNLEYFRKIAYERNGKCISDNYKNTLETLKFECEYGHIFETTGKCILRGNWCKLCTKYTMQRYCKYIFEHLFLDEFNTVKPSFLKINNKMILELDGYNDKLKLAFEYNGIQHYEFNKFFHGTKSKFVEQKQRDILKKNLCEINNVNLVVIPYTVKYDSLYEFIKIECIKLNYCLNEKKIDLTKYKISFFNDKLNRINLIAKERGGKCLSTVYIGSQSNLTFICEKEHVFDTTPNSLITQKTWCSICKKNEKLVEINKIAKDRGGACLSINYTNRNIKLVFRCIKNHTFERTANDLIFRNGWCNECKKIDL